MSWHDPDRSGEPEDETALRNDLRGLLGLPARDARSSYFEIEPTPELIRLADDLRREARRRTHTVRKRSSWLLAAAALPFAVTLAGVGAWGLAQKHRVDQLNARVAEQESQVQRLAMALQAVPAAVPRRPAGGDRPRRRGPAAPRSCWWAREAPRASPRNWSSRWNAPPNPPSTTPSGSRPTRLRSRQGCGARNPSGPFFPSRHSCREGKKGSGSQAPPARLRPPGRIG